MVAPEHPGYTGSMRRIGAQAVTLSAVFATSSLACSVGSSGGNPFDGAPGPVADGRTGGALDGGDAHAVTGGDAGPALGHDAGSGMGHDAGSGHDAGQPVDAGHDTAGGGHDAGSHDTGTGLVDAPLVHHDAGQIAVVYGHSASTLYGVNPNTHAVTTIGLFAGCDSSVIDIALDKTSKMYATTGDSVYTVDTANAACTLLGSLGSYPNSLSFVPAGTLDPNVEALVGYQGATYVRIDTTTGAITNVGSLGSGSPYTSSGDIVSVIGGGTYLTVTGGTDCASNDCLVEVDPKTGTLITNFGSVQHSQVYGIAYWAGNVYGFDNAGQLFEVTFPDAGGLGVTTIPIPNPPLGLSFYGAGSTTAAPRK